ncbi:hypothetical protein [uncultured Bradyrhizobium sp.]|uniref:hypothetical protein n=1 Tax=uncultured Bradyrhizobium sp. TaxID=199684 RepID=UPI0035C94D60
MKRNNEAGGACPPGRWATSRTVKRYADTLSQRGALGLAKRLEHYWHQRGFPAARFWTEPVNERFSKVGTYEIYRVVCNLVNGWPPRYAR